MHFSFSKRWGVLDFKVWLSFIIVAILSLGFMGYKIVTDVNCLPVKIVAIGKLNATNNEKNLFFKNEEITFTTQIEKTKNNQKVVWNFGDNTNPQSGISVAHVYTAEGSYMVTATINGSCQESFAVRITDGTLGLHISNAPTINPIVTPDVLNIGDESNFSSTQAAKIYSWSIQELPQLGTISDPNAKFIFPATGTYTIKLVLDNIYNFTKVIQVIDPAANLATAAPLPPAIISEVPPPPTPTQDLPEIKKVDEEPTPKKEETPKEETPPPKPKKSYDLLPLPAIQQMLEDVTEGKKDVDDFSSQLCNGAGTKVVANDKPTTFAALCMELKKKKRKMILFKKEKSIQSLKVVRDEENGNCITLMYVSYK